MYLLENRFNGTNIYYIVIWKFSTLCVWSSSPGFSKKFNRLYYSKGNSIQFTKMSIYKDKLRIWLLARVWRVLCEWLLVTVKFIISPNK